MQVPGRGHEVMLMALLSFTLMPVRVSWAVDVEGGFETLEVDDPENIRPVG
jgi:hypothetical protein